jgi:hypothetical protein
MPVTTSDDVVFYIFFPGLSTVDTARSELEAYLHQRRRRGTLSATRRICTLLDRDLSEVLPTLKSDLEHKSSFRSLDDFEPEQLYLFVQLFLYLRFLSQRTFPLTAPCTSAQLVDLFHVLEYPAKFLLKDCGFPLFHTFLEQLDVPRLAAPADPSSRFDFLGVKRVYTAKGAVLYLPQSMWCMFEELYGIVGSKVKEFYDSGVMPLPPEDMENPCKDMASLVPYYFSTIEPAWFQRAGEGSFACNFGYWCFLKPLAFLWNDDREVTVPVQVSEFRLILQSLLPLIEFLLSKSALRALTSLSDQCFRQDSYCQ